MCTHLEHEREERPWFRLSVARALAVAQAQRAQLRVSGRRVLGGVVREDSGAVEGAVVLGEVQPALEPGARRTATNKLRIVNKGLARRDRKRSLK